MKKSRVKLSRFSRTALRALQEAVRNVEKARARAGRPMIVWEDGRVKRLMPAEIATARPRRLK